MSELKMPQVGASRKEIVATGNQKTYFGKSLVKIAKTKLGNIHYCLNLSLLRMVSMGSPSQRN